MRNIEFVKHKPVVQHEDSVGEISKAISSNPLVYDSIINFQAGERLHTIKTCNVCYTTRPVYHVTTASNLFKTLEKEEKTPVPVPDWSVNKNGVCTKCKNVKNHPSKYSGIKSKIEHLAPASQLQRHNNMHFEEVPSVLKDLSLMEEMLIRKVTVAMHVHTLKYGMFASKGHSVSIPNDMKIALELPLLPEEVGVIIIRKPGSTSKSYLVERRKVQSALDALVFGIPNGGSDTPLTPQHKFYHGPDHKSGKTLRNKYFLLRPNPYYADVTICEHRLNKLPIQKGELEGLLEYNLLDDEEDEDKGPAPNMFDKLSSDAEVTSRSAIVTPVNFDDQDEEVKKMLQKFTGTSINQNSVATAQLHNDNSKEPLRELKVAGFFSMAYPTIFVNGSCDITIKALHPVPYQEWVSHIYYNVDNRVSAHPYLKFHLMNINLKKKALDQGSFVVAQQINDIHLTVEQLLQNIQSGDNSVADKISKVGSNIPTTGPYWYQRKREVEALAFFNLKESDCLPTYFDTSSCAEHQWQALHNLIIAYYSKVKEIDIQEAVTKFNSDSKFKHALIMNNLHIVTEYFSARHANYANSVLKELFYWTDVWFRSEFAKSRGQIHSHDIYFSKTHHKIINSIMESDNVSEIPNELFKFFQTQEYDDEDEQIYSPHFVSMHPASGHETLKNNVKFWEANKNDWPPPEGTGQLPKKDSLSQELKDITTIDELNELQKDVINKVMLHGCSSSYCLRRRMVKPPKKSRVCKNSLQNKNIKEKVVQQFCRFGYGVYNKDTKTMSGKNVHPFEPKIDSNLGEKQKHPRYEGPCDHPRMVQHPMMRAVSWQGNADTQPLIERDIISLIYYVCGYACKGVPRSNDFIKTFDHILTKANPNTSLRSLAQQFLLKQVGLIDIPASMADFFNTGNHLYYSSRRYNRVGLSGSRIIKRKNDGTNEMTQVSTLDKFLCDKRRADFPDITLYDHTKKCTCPKKQPCGQDHVPLFTGIRTMPTWPVTEEYAKGQLMIHSPGTWHKVDDLMQQYETYAEAFAAFVDSPDCPKAVKIILKSVKAKYNQQQERSQKRQDKKNDHQFSNENANANIQSPPSTQPTNYSSQFSSQQSSQYLGSEDNSNSLGAAMLRDILNAFDNDALEPMSDDLPLPDGGNSFNWNQYAKDSFNKMCQFPTHSHDDMPSDCDTWLQTTIGDLEKSQYTNHC